MHEAVLFARIGWMKEYRGPQPGDERPEGAGEYTKSKMNLGHEAFNFLPVEDCVYGYIQPAGRTLNLERIAGGECEDSLNDALVVFVSKHPKEGVQRVVGWYENATVFRESHNSRHPERKGFDYFAVTEVKNAVLLPLAQRKCEVPSGKRGMGQANICYLYHPDRSPKQCPWVEQVLKFIENY